MSFNGGEDFDYMVDEGDMANVMDDEVFGDSSDRERVEVKDDYELVRLLSAWLLLGFLICFCNSWFEL